MSKVPDNVKNFVLGVINGDSSNKEISVIINENPPLARQLNTESTLEYVREQLSNPDEKLCIYDNMSFIGPNGEIERIDESKKSLKETLTGDKGDILRINKPLGYLNEREVINKYKLEYGWKISKDRLVCSEEKAFEFDKPIKNQLIIRSCHKYDNKTETCRNSCEKDYLKCFIAGVNVNATLPWQLPSINFSASHERRNQKTDSLESSTTYDVKDHMRSIVEITKILPTNEFKQAVESANSRLELEEITKKFGEYVIREMKLGGKVISIKNSSNLIQQESNKNSFNVGIKLNAKNIAGGEISGSYEHGKNENSSLQETSTCFEVLGGDNNKYRNDDLNEWEWEKSLIDCTKWEIITYNKIESIFSILDEELRQKVIKIIIGQKILQIENDSIKKLKLFPNRPYKHELKIYPSLQSNLQDCQIFASIMNKKKDVFSVQVIHSGSSASLLLHRISDDDKNKSESYDLQIGWIIIGYPKDFNNVTNEFKVNISNTVLSDTSIPFQRRESCLLASCAYKAPMESNSNPLKSNIVAGVCFCENSTLKAFAYDLKSKKQNHENTFSTHYSLIQIPSESNQTYYEFKKKRKNWKLSKLSSNSTSYTLVNNQEQPLWTCDNDLIFFSLLLNNNNLGFACITPKKLLFKPINESVCEQLQISCFRMQSDIFKA